MTFDEVHEIVEATLAELCTRLGCGGATIALVDSEGQMILMDEVHATESAGQTTRKIIKAVMKELDIDDDELEVTEIVVTARPEVFLNGG